MTNRELNKVEVFSNLLQKILTQKQARGEKPEKTFSRTFNLRISPELHAKLAFQAQTIGISLNTYVTEKLRFAVE